MNSPCDSCAFNTPGTPGAASEVKNRLKGLICAHGPLPFFCHHAKSGAEYDWRSPDTLGPLSLAPAERKICGGWQRFVRRLNARGFFRFGSDLSPSDLTALRRYQRGLAAETLRTLERFTSEQDPQQKEIERGRLTDLVRATFGKP